MPVRPEPVIVLVGVLASAPVAAAQGPGVLPALARLAGRLHPVVVHFPVALLITAAAVEVWRTIRGRPGVSPVSMACAAIGAAGAALAAGSGWLNAAYERTGPDSATLQVHRWLGVGTAAAALLVAALGAGAARRPRLAAAYRALLVSAGVAVGVGSHYGGMLVYGEDYLASAVRGVVRARGGGGASGAPPVAGGGPPASADPGAPRSARPNGAIDFESQVRPILAAACFECHGRGKRKGGLALDDRAAAARGGRHGAAIRPGDSENSLLIRRVLGLDDEDRMPLERDPLTGEQVAVLRAWIDQGAPWPEGG
jgi:uncharacterized membrane protein